MDIDCIEQDKTDDSDDPVTQKQWTKMAASVAAIATAVKNSSNSNLQGMLVTDTKYNYNRNSYQNSSNNSPVNSTHPVNRGPNTYSNNNRYENQRQNFVRHNLIIGLQIGIKLCHNKMATQQIAPPPQMGK